jgi:hypothetical protein
MATVARSRPLTGYSKCICSMEFPRQDSKYVYTGNSHGVKGVQPFHKAKIGRHSGILYLGIYLGVLISHCSTGSKTRCTSCYASDAPKSPYALKEISSITGTTLCPCAVMKHSSPAAQKLSTRSTQRDVQKTCQQGRSRHRFVSTLSVVDKRYPFLVQQQSHREWCGRSDVYLHVTMGSKGISIYHLVIYI